MGTVCLEERPGPAAGAGPQPAVTLCREARPQGNGWCLEAVVIAGWVRGPPGQLAWCPWRPVSPVLTVPVRRAPDPLARDRRAGSGRGAGGELGVGPASCTARLSIRRSLPCSDLRWVLNASQSLHSGQSRGEGGHPTQASYPKAASAATVHPTAGASGVGAAPSPHDPEKRAGRLLPSHRRLVLCAVATGRASSTLRGVLAFRSSDSDLTSCPRSPGRVPAARRLCGAPSLCPCAGPCPPERVLPVSVVASARKQPGRAVSAPRAVGGLME